MREIRTEIEIDAPPERVWSILTDFAAHAEWNPYMRLVRGGHRIGNQLCVGMQMPGSSRITTFCPDLLVFEKNRELRWRGKVLIRGLFDGEHVFELHPTDDARTRFVHREEFRGILVPLFARMFPRLEKAFHAMNDALKLRAEGVPAETG